jgi:hypothetical protein
MTANDDFSAPYDGIAKAVSAFVCVLVMAIPLAIHTVPMAPILGGLGLFVLILAYAYSPRGYRMAERAIRVKRLIGDVRIPLEDVREARIASAEDFAGCIRLWGSEGLFGYYGVFRTSKLGKCTWYATSRRNRVVVITAAKTVVFSPDDPDGFVAAIRASVPVSATAAGEMRATPTAAGLGWRLWAGVLVGGLSVALVAVAMLYSPGPPSYTLTRDSLTIHDRFYPVTLSKGEVDVAGIRVVDLAVDGGWRPTERTDGFANTHYQSGWFRAANGQRIRMYRAGGKRLVLLPLKRNGAAVLLQVQDPDGFVTELRKAWGGS